MKKPVIKGNTITIPSSQNYLVDVDNFLENLLHNYGADKSLVADIAISVTEIVNNSIIHGNKSIPDKIVSVMIENTDSNVRITITDQGNGFDPDKIENPVEDRNLLKEVGRGIFIVKSLMDSVEINNHPNGTQVVLTKKI